MPNKRTTAKGKFARKEGATELTKESQTSMREKGRIVKVPRRKKSDTSIFHINTLSKLNEFIASAFCHPLVSRKLRNLLGGSYLYSFNHSRKNFQLLMTAVELCLSGFI